MKDNGNADTYSLFTYTTVVFLFGASVALLCHYVDYGWNPGAAQWAKYVLILGTVALAVFVVAGFSVISATIKKAP